MGPRYGGTEITSDVVMVFQLQFSIFCGHYLEFGQFFFHCCV
jgi:hypothetical protein